MLAAEAAQETEKKKGVVPASHDNGCLGRERTSDAVPIGVMTEYNGGGPREGQRDLLCDEYAQVKDYARAFITQERHHYGSNGGVEWMGINNPKSIYGFSYHITSERMKAEYDEIGTHQFDAWVHDI